MRLERKELDENKLVVIIEEDDVNKSMYDFNKWFKSIEAMTKQVLIVDASKIDYLPLDFLSILVRIYDIAERCKLYPPTLLIKGGSVVKDLLTRAHFNQLYNIEEV